MRPAILLALYVSLVTHANASSGAALNAIAAEAKAALNSGDYATAESRLRLGVQQAGENTDGARFRAALADLLREQGRADESRPLYVWISKRPGLDPRVRFNALSGIADLDGLSHKSTLALKEWNDALAFTRSLPSGPMENEALTGLANTWLESGVPAKAEPLLIEAVTGFEREQPRRNTMLAFALVTLGACYRAEDRLELAEESLTRALELEKEIFPEHHPQLAYLLERLAPLLALRGEWETARQYASRAIADMRACCGYESAAEAAAFVTSAGVESAIGDRSAAIRNLSTAMTIAQAIPSGAVLRSRIAQASIPLLKAEHRGREAKAMTAFLLP